MHVNGDTYEGSRWVGVRMQELRFDRVKVSVRVRSRSREVSLLILQRFLRRVEGGDVVGFGLRFGVAAAVGTTPVLAGLLDRME